MENSIRCKKCGTETENKLTLVTIKTLTDRGMKKNKYYQAMGDVFETGICDDCLDQYIEELKNPNKKILKKALVSGLILLACAGLFFFVQYGPFQVLCAVLGALSVIAFVQEYKHIKKESNEVKNRKSKENRKLLSVKLLSTVLPKKHNDADLQYIDKRRIMTESLEVLGKEQGVSHNKLIEIRNYFKNEEEKKASN
jgi:hypothetical protein